MVAEYIFQLQSIGYRPLTERVAYYLLPIIPTIVLFVSAVLGYKGKKIRRLIYALGLLALLWVAVFFLKIRLPGHRADYSAWEGITVWGIVPSQESAIVMFVSDTLAAVLAVAGCALGKGVRKALRRLHCKLP